MKISCVRCGKKIDSPNVYCKECQKDMGIAIGSPPRSKRRWYTYIIILLIIAFAGYYVMYLDHGEIVTKISTVAQDVENKAEELKQIVFNQLQIEETKDADAHQELVIAEIAETQKLDQSTPQEPKRELPEVSQSDEVKEPSVAPAADEAVGAPEEKSETAVPDATPPAEPATEEVKTEAPSQEAVAAEPAAEQPESTPEQPVEAPATSPEQTASDTEAPQESAATVAEQAPAETPEPTAPAEQVAAKPDNPLLHVGIQIYYLKNKGADVKVQQKLQEAGYTNVVAQGKWPGAFNDQNVFCRSEDQPGVSEIMAILGDNWYQYYFNGERISSIVKKIFRTDESIQFLIIPK